jgi:formylglycine-generating enzyme required for sulfatase activity
MLTPYDLIAVLNKHLDDRLQEQGSHPGMVLLAGGTFRIGSNHHHTEEVPAHRVTVDGFWINCTPVINRQFGKFVRATGHVTFAEKVPDPTDYPGSLPDLIFAGSLVFTPPKTLLKGANWRRPYGLRSSLSGLSDHPVVHIAYRDALAYAAWADKSLSTEAEWEFAARGGLGEAEYAWGDELMPAGKHRANTWQGNFPNFPHDNLLSDGVERASPVTAFPPNGYGVHDMIGNVWEWTTDWYAPTHERSAPEGCCASAIPPDGSENVSYDPRQPEIRIPAR